MKSTDSKAKQLAAYIRKNPDDSFSKFALALEFLKADEIHRARILFEDIRTNEPGYTGIYYHLGGVYERLGRLQDARETYEKGIRIASDQHKNRTVSELTEVLAELNFEMEEA